jgi:four helix bundle protein
MISNLKVFKKSYDFLLWIYPVIKKFPKSEKYTLGEKIKNCILDLLENIIYFCKNKNKLKYLQKIDLNLEKLRIFIRIGKDLNIISFKKYDFAEKQITDIGLLIGGLIKKYNFKIPK